MKMKKITGFVCALFLAQLSFGQITLEHSYNGSLGYISRNIASLSVTNYFLPDLVNATFTIYNLDHSIYKIVKLDIPDGAILTAMDDCYTNMINSDPLIELFYTVKYKDSQDIERSDIYLINEDAELIKKFENIDVINLMNSDEGPKLVATSFKNENHYGHKTNIYSLPTSSHISISHDKNVGLPYPNPSNSLINIPYQLIGQQGTIFIYNSSGQLITQKNVDKSFNNLLLDVSSYSKGFYYYKVEKQKGEFIVN